MQRSFLSCHPSAQDGTHIWHHLLRNGFDYPSLRLALHWRRMNNYSNYSYRRQAAYLFNDTVNGSSQMVVLHHFIRHKMGLGSHQVKVACIAGSCPVFFNELQKRRKALFPFGGVVQPNAAP